MNCENAQRLLDDLSRGRLPETQAREVRNHLEDCTDCRVLHQRSQRLQQLMSLMRHERPASPYFDGFLEEFHQRLASDTVPSWTTRLTASMDKFVEQLGFQPTPRMRFGLAMAGVGVVASLFFAVSPLIYAPGTSGSSNTIAAETPRTEIAIMEPELLNFPVPVGRVAESPRYVLDQITITPVSYDVAQKVPF